MRDPAAFCELVSARQTRYVSLDGDVALTESQKEFLIDSPTQMNARSGSPRMLSFNVCVVQFSCFRKAAIQG